MRDLTHGAIWRHLLSMAMFIAAGLIVQTLYLLIDLYFVSRLGKEAVAGVAAAGNSSYATMALAQLVGVGSLSLVSQAVGRKDRDDAQLIFEQALSLGLIMGLIFLVLGYLAGGWGVGVMAADPQSATYGRAYLFAFLPSLALMYPTAAMGSALRAAGVVGAPMMIQAVTVVLNAVLAPVLIAGWGTGHPLGVMGAGLASTIAASFGSLAILVLFNRLQTYMHLSLAQLKPVLAVWKRIAKVGLPATGEFMLLFIVTSVVYWAVRGFGAQAQAGFGIGSRVMQAIFLPAMAVAFACAPIAGQNFGARQGARVRKTFITAAAICSGFMVLLTLLCHINPGLLVSAFTRDPAVIAAAVSYLRIGSYNFVAVGLTFSCSGMFQALGDTRPSLLSSGSRVITYVVPAIWMSGQSWVTLDDFWYLSVASVTVQAVIALLMLRIQFRHKLNFIPGVA